ncbi:hypothetical protein F4780DRAFT_632070 [Xylariomycetidae sp. FL0641]|nr:hypothetical protein F4780DRAFT_632070 [Xylariomycetidae sp. FL0641]
MMKENANAINEPAKDSGICFAPFFERCKLPGSAKADCDAFARSRFAGEIRPVPFQGYCSYTLSVGKNVILQFRPSTHMLDLDVARTACQVFGSLAPETDYLGELDGTGLHGFSMTRLPGISLFELSIGSTHLRIGSLKEQVVRGFAQLQVTSWKHAKQLETVHVKRLVGSTLLWRLELMATGLPQRFQNIIRSVLTNLPAIQALPWVFSHGDFLPANIMVSPDSGRILGLLDWAEAEYLPFGIGMYGLEELLGESRDGHFAYYPDAEQLRLLFWKELLLEIPELAQDTEKLTMVRTAQKLGILLWHGIAFDDGKLDRACEDGRDDEEIQKLDMFLLSTPKTELCKQRIGRSVRCSPLSFFRGLLFGKTPSNLSTDLRVNRATPNCRI